MSGGSSKTQTVGYKYHLDMHMALCHGPVDAINKIIVDQNRLAWAGSATGNMTVTINKPELYGGEPREGGISGDVDFEFGAPDQPINSYLSRVYRNAHSAFRGVVCAIAKNVYWGNNPYLKAAAFEVSRVHTRTSTGELQWYDEAAQITPPAGVPTMNPAHIIRECLTDEEWGMGLAAAEIDDISFAVAADRLVVEDFGLCLLWTSEMPIEEFVLTILDHIDASLYTSRETGKFVLKLIRDDYDIDIIPVLDEDSIWSISDFKKPAIGELVNQVTVQFDDLLSSKEDSITVQDIALQQQQGASISVTKQYPGIPIPSLAAKIASRELRALSSPIISCKIQCDRRVATDLNVGDVFKLNWSQYGLSNVVMRVTSLGFGTPNNNMMQIECVQDVFSLSEAIYAPPPPTQNLSITSDPAAVTLNVLREAPYWEVAQRLGDTEAAKLEEGDAYVIGSGVRPASALDAINASMHLGFSASDTERVGTTEFCPTGILNQDIEHLTDGFQITNTLDMEQVEVGQYLEMSGEFMQITSITDTSLTVKRGILDTLPRQHVTGERFYIWEVNGNSDERIYVEGDVVHMRLTPVTGNGELELVNSISTSLTIVGRAFRPYPPANVQINTSYYPATFTGDLAITWAHRDRLQQTANIIDFTEPSISPEPGVSYRVVIANTDTNTELLNISTVEPNYTYTEAQELADHGENATNYQIEITTVRNGVESLESFVWGFSRI